MSGTATTADTPGALHPKHAEWLSERGIRSDTAEAMNVTTQSDKRGNWLVFPYRLDGKLVNRKFRLTREKDHRLDSGGKLCLWNAECLRSDPVAKGASVVITEGEFDALIAMQCGFDHTVSVPNGAPAEAVDDPANSNRYRFLYETESDLERVAGFVIATDGDRPGIQLAHDLAHILGAERCKFVTYPEGCKDLNEVFLRDGQEGVTRVLNGAKPFPVRGLYSLDDIPEAPPVQGMETGIDALEGKMQVVLGTLTVFTGYANMGKSTVLNTIIANAVSKGVSCCVAAFETLPKPILVDGIAKALLGCSNLDYERHPHRDTARRRVHDFVGIITNALDEEMEMDLETYLDTCRIAAVRDGARLFVLDPWNELEHKRERDETQTEYIGRAIRRIKAFARRYNVAFWIVAHPTKPMKGVNSIPSLYDVSDSANWSNKADYGLVYHRPDKTVNEATLAVVKVRMGLPGECGAVKVKFDVRENRIRDYDA
ncbi:toprim domain-containing protein [Sphingomicrobium sp. XHP0235]|uniref:toprim domain-containing protein n=1 Tax=Sphingomicrobium aquimarinum TaxID=3133971 RepID=UPI0031FE9966